MKAVQFPQVTNNVAENQKQYNTLPSFIGKDESADAVVNVSCFELTDDEVSRIVKYKKIWHRALTFGGGLQPFNIFAVEDYFKYKEDKPKTKIKSGFKFVKIEMPFLSRLKYLFLGSATISIEYKIGNGKGIEGMQDLELEDYSK